MLEKVKNFYKDPEMVCQSCGKVIKVGDEITATFVMPSEKKMPVGQLKLVIHNIATSIRCKDC